jgi:hypothetical protein
MKYKKIWNIVDWVGAIISIGLGSYYIFTRYWV